MTFFKPFVCILNFKALHPRKDPVSDPCNNLGSIPEKLELIHIFLVICTGAKPPGMNWEVPNSKICADSRADTTGLQKIELNDFKH